MAQVTAESLHLHYISARPGLWPITMGVLKGMSQEFWGFDLDLTLIKSRDEGDDHEVRGCTWCCPAAGLLMLGSGSGDARLPCGN